MRAKVIYNPKSGKRKLQAQMSYVVEQLSQAGYSNVEIYPTKAPGDAARAADKARHYDLIIVAGGDGTISEVVNGLLALNQADGSEQTRPVLGYIPSGTSNDFASALRIPSDVKKAVRIITHGHRAQVDIGSINQERSFNYIVAAGAFTRLTYTTPHHLKRLLGVWAYLKDFFREIPMIQKPFRLKLSVDGKKISGEYVIALVINSPNFAGMRKVIPGACMDDGILDIILLPKSNPKVLISAIRSMAVGVDERIHGSGILHLSGQKIVIEAEKRLDWNIDGELGGRGPIEIECCQKVLDIMVPSIAMYKVLSHQKFHQELHQTLRQKAASETSTAEALASKNTNKKLNKRLSRKSGSYSSKRFNVRAKNSKQKTQNLLKNIFASLKTIQKKKLTKEQL